jgi:hypothetical protein
MAGMDKVFAGSIPEIYEQFLVFGRAAGVHRATVN